MDRFFRFIVAVSTGLNRAFVFLSELALAALMLITSYGVIARYVFGNPSIHAVEVSAYILLVAAWGAVGWVHLVDRHVRMEALNACFKGRSKKVADAFSELMILVFCGVLIWTGINAVMNAIDRNYHSATLLRFPLSVLYAAIPIGALLLGLAAVHRLVESCRSDGSRQQAGN